MSFQKLTVDCLRTLRPLLQSKLPETTQILNIVDLFFKGKHSDEERKKYTAELYGIPDTEIVSVIWTPSNTLTRINPITSLLHVPPPSPDSQLDTKDVIEAYKNLINWDKPHHFEAVPVHFAHHLEKIIKDKNGIVKEKTPILMYYLPEDGIKSLNPRKWAEAGGDLFEICDLKPEHAKKINRYWKYANEDGANALAIVIKNVGCARGIFKKGQLGSGGLVSWGLLLPLGRIGSLYTMDVFRGHGLAQWTFEEISKEAVEKYGIIPCFEVEHTNAAGKILMKKIGMKVMGDVCWMKYIPPVVQSARRKAVALSLLKLL